MTNEVKKLIADVESEYDRDDGFLGLLRGGHFDTLARDRYLRLLQSIDFDGFEMVDRRLVALFLYMPLFLQWQEPRLDDDERNALGQTVDRVTSELERILGVP
jgi:hypothetical protein